MIDPFMNDTESKSDQNSRISEPVPVILSTSSSQTTQLLEISPSHSNASTLHPSPSSNPSQPMALLSPMPSLPCSSSPPTPSSPSSLSPFLPSDGIRTSSLLTYPQPSMLTSPALLSLPCQEEKVSNCKSVQEQILSTALELDAKLVEQEEDYQLPSETKWKQNFNWNEYYQSLYDQSAATPHEIKERQRNLALLVKDYFIAFSTQVVQVIVDEMEQSEEVKKLRPQPPANVSIFGEQFRFNNILFKFADPQRAQDAKQETYNLESEFSHKQGTYLPTTLNTHTFFFLHILIHKHTHVMRILASAHNHSFAFVSFSCK